MTEQDLDKSPVLSLDPGDLEFVVRFVLASGSLKDVAQSYGVSYPTIRSRLDRLIGRLEGLRSGKPVDAMSELLARLVEQGQVTASAAREIQRLYRQEIGKHKGAI